jgi:hypothetical protein
VLSGLLKKIIPADYGHSVYNVSNMQTLEALVSGMT